MTDPIKAKIIELVPDIQMASCELCDSLWPMSMAGGRCDGYGCGALIRPSKIARCITLADVLRAIDKSTSKTYCIDAKGFFGYEIQRYDGDEAEGLFSFKMGKSNRAVWNLTTDYDGQTQEVKDFIGKLLGV